MPEVTVVYECQTCWARASTPEAIEHQPVIRHPASGCTTDSPLMYELERLEFPIIDRPSPGLFGRTP